MKYKYITGIIGLALIIILSAFYISNKNENLSILKDAIKNNRNFNYKTNEETKSKFEKLLYNYKDFSDEIPSEKIMALQEGVYTYDITKEEALKDVEYMFKVIKYGYAGYEYFGGDNTFLKAKNNIIKDLNYSTENVIAVKDFSKILFDNLKFIKDGHFIIGDYIFEEYIHFDYFNNEDYYFKKDKEGYYTDINHKRYYVTSIDNSTKVDEYIKPSLDYKGNIVYFIGKLENTKEEKIQINVSLKNKDEILNKVIILSKVIPDTLPDIAYNYREVNHIPVIENSRMSPNNDNNKLNEFVNNASNLKDKDIFVIDLRGNSGGSDIYPMQWIKNYTGEYPEYGIISGDLYTNTSIKLKTDNSILSPENEKSIKKQNHFPGWKSVTNCNNKIIDNKNIIIVLIDSNVVSSGEDFIGYLRHLNNVIFVGSNTAGVKTVGNICNWVLPFSDLKIRSGTTLFMESTLENTEGIGYSPDLWAKSDEALERALKFISKNPKYFLRKLYK